jgi:hypothetical protein
LLVLSTADTPDWRAWDRDDKVTDCLVDFEEVTIERVDAADVMACQTEKQTQRQQKKIKLAQPYMDTYIHSYF